MPTGKYPRKPVQERLTAHLTRQCECLVWTGATTKQGYGHMKVDGKTITVHRLTWLLNKGEIPPGMCVLHTCDNPPCCNPDHLFLGTDLDNKRDAMGKGRRMGNHGKPRDKTNAERQRRYRQRKAQP